MIYYMEIQLIQLVRLANFSLFYDAVPAVRQIMCNRATKAVVYSNCPCFFHWKKKSSHFDLKNWVTGGTKIQPGIPSNWKIFESNCIVNLSFIIESIWLRYPSITRNPGSNFSSTSDSTFYVKMTPFFLSVNIMTLFLMESLCFVPVFAPV